MANNVKNLPFPDWILVLDCNIKIDGKGITEDGVPNTGISKDTKCAFSEKTKRIITPEGKRIDLVGKVIIKGDIAPGIAKISGGCITIGNKTMDIYSCARPRNPDGSIYSSNFEVM